jgi:hypothetical protein
LTASTKDLVASYCGRSQLSTKYLGLKPSRGPFR